jgi:hypothetical protein
MMIPNYYQKLLDAGLPVLSASDDGAASFSRDLANEERLAHYRIITPPTNEQIIAEMKTIVRSWMDACVQARGYDNLMTAISYTDDLEHMAWQAESIAVKRWRSRVYDALQVIEADCLAGTRNIPTAEELITELPVLEWPA